LGFALTTRQRDPMPWRFWGFGFIGGRRAHLPSILGKSNDNQLAMHFGGTELCDDDDVNISIEGGHDNKKWQTAMRCWKCDGERGKDADITIKLRGGKDGRKP
jgi:hypothetical protein